MKAVLRISHEEDVQKISTFEECKTCEYNPCDFANNLDYCPAVGRRISEVK